VQTKTHGVSAYVLAAKNVAASSCNGVNSISCPSYFILTLWGTYGSGKLTAACSIVVHWHPSGGSGASHHKNDCIAYCNRSGFSNFLSCLLLLLLLVPPPPEVFFSDLTLTFFFLVPEDDDGDGDSSLRFFLFALTLTSSSTFTFFFFFFFFTGVVSSSSATKSPSPPSSSSPSSSSNLIFFLFLFTGGEAPPSSSSFTLFLPEEEAGASSSAAGGSAPPSKVNSSSESSSDIAGCCWLVDFAVLLLCLLVVCMCQTNWNNCNGQRAKSSPFSLPPLLIIIAALLAWLAMLCLPRRLNGTPYYFFGCCLAGCLRRPLRGVAWTLRRVTPFSARFCARGKEKRRKRRSST